MNIRYLVIWKRDADPPEVFPFESEAEADGFYDKAATNWTDVYLCEVKRGPRQDKDLGSSTEERHGR